MRILCVLNGGPGHPSSRFRVVQHIETLRGRGAEVDLLVAKRSEGYDLRTLRRRALAADVVLLQKKLFASWKLHVLPRSTPVVFDFDDALFAPTPEECDRHGDRAANSRAAARARRLRSILLRSRQVIAGNGFLAAHAARYAADVAILPTGVDLATFPEETIRAAALRRRARSAERLIGWIGSQSSLRYLPALAGALRSVCDRVPGARLVQVCDGFIDLPGVPTEKRRWSAAREATDLMDFDVGLMPLDDGDFSRGKCGLKILQYQAAGVPVLCSPVGANRDIVIDGATGLFASGAAGWEEGLTRLLSDPGLSNRLGAAGRINVVEHYAAGVVGGRLADLVLGAAAPRRSRGRRRRRARSGSAALPGEEGEGEGQPGQHQRLLVAHHLPERPAVRLRSVGTD